MTSQINIGQKAGSFLRFFVLAAGCLAVASAAEYQVSPQGSSSGNGSESSPWDLSTALAHPSSVRPGDTIWLRGGTYRGAFTSSLRGDSGAPVTVRAYPGERVTLDGAPSSSTTLTVNGQHTWFWGFEITNSSTAPRVDSKSNFDLRPYALAALGPNLKLINLVIHDAGSGIGLWNTSVDTEVYGCYVYYNGWTDPNRGHGEGVYIQNSAGTKRLIDNVMFNQFDHGIMAYGSSNARVDNIYYEGNVLYSNGKLTAEPNGWGVLIGGGQVANNHTLLANHFYNTFDYRRSNNLDIAYGQGSTNINIVDNYSSGYMAVNYEKSIANLTATGNTFIGGASSTATGQISSSANTFLSTPPSSNRIFVRRNRYDNTRATVIVYNWAGSTTVGADLAGFLAPGDRYEVRKIENYFAGAVASGTAASGEVALPMTNYEIAAPMGSVPTYPATTFPTFGVFEIRKTSGGGSPVVSVTAPVAVPAPVALPAPVVVPTPVAVPAPVAISAPVVTPAPAAIPPAPVPASTPSAFTVVLEGESGVLDSQMLPSADAGALGGQFISSTMAGAGSALFPFAVADSGTYAVWVRVRATSPATDSFLVSVNNSPDQLFELEGNWSPQWQWVRLTTRGTAWAPTAPTPWNLQLNGGTHTIQIRSREANSQLDQILITADMSFVPR